MGNARLRDTLNLLPSTPTTEPNYLPPPHTQLLQTGVSLIVDDGKPTPEAAVSRRRPGGGKRKRRPQLPLATMGANEEENNGAYWRGHVEDDHSAAAAGNVGVRRKQLPIREPMAALERERDRHRQRPTEAPAVGGKAYRRPYGQAKKQDQEQQLQQQQQQQLMPTAATGNRTPVDLKNILKNSGGLSLSEILQQKNLSLDDLLKGKQNALLALQTTAVAPASASQEPKVKATGQSSNGNNKHGVRRIPAAFLTHEQDVEEQQQQQQQQQEDARQQEDSREELFKPKQNKLPALQRLKLFGSSSREGSSTRRTLHASSTAATATVASSTTTTTTTTRLPLYKKRQQMRSTLKPPALFKATASSTTATITTTAAAAAATAAATELDEQQLLLETTTAAVTAAATVAPEADVSEEENSSELPPATRYRTRHNSNNRGSSNSNRDRDSSNRDSNNKQEQTKRLRDNIIGSIYDRNSVESIEDVELELAENVVSSEATHSTAATHNSNSSSSNRFGNNSAEQLGYNDGNDELENFFDEVESNTQHISVPAPITTARPSSPTMRVRAKQPRPQAQPQPQPQQQSPAPMILMDDVDDRTDLLELIEDRRSGNRLFKVLEQRNMTLEELIEHRKRGSSQLHLSTILSTGKDHSRFYPGQKVVLQDNMDIVTAFENFPHFNLIDLKSVKPDEIKTDSQGSSYFTSIIDIEPNNDNDDNGDNNNDNNNRNRGPTYAQSSLAATATAQQQQQQQLQRGEKSLGFFPSWKTLALASLATATAARAAAANADDKRSAYYLPPPRLLLDGNSQEQDDSNSSNNSNNSNNNNNNSNNNSMDIDLSVNTFGGASNRNVSKLAPSEDNSDVIDTIENEVARAHDLLDLELSGHGFRRSPAAAAATSMSQQHLGNLYASMPAGIRSAIVASAAIVLTSLGTFMVIFVVCRWKQHRRRKTSYLKTYNAMKSKLPQLAQTANASRRSSLRQHMEELVVSSSNSSDGCHKPTIATVSCSTPVHQQQQQSHQLQRQSSLLFSREGCCASSLTKAATVAAAATTTTGAAAATTTTTATATAAGRGVGSLALTLRSTHQKLNTMDPNSPEVQEYLFDTLRKSFDN
ncbi:ras guanine nucleotide exchange factor P [Drosophila montana]|uniref:ras guanine nucleotide exchange factor P n=1 Tax=Drosophila montana TaxID=40370 RepID=UPI00313BDE7C